MGVMHVLSYMYTRSIYTLIYTYAEIIPVDLNSILYKYEVNLGLLQTYMIKNRLIVINSNKQSVIQNANKDVCSHSSNYYATAAANRAAGMNALLWVEELGLWLDYNITAQTVNNNGTLDGVNA